LNEAAGVAGPKDLRSVARSKVTREVPSILKEQVEKLCSLFPESVCEGKVDFEKLQSVLGASVDGRPERYTFTWAGKRNSIQILQMPTRATLTPVKDSSVNFDSSENLFIEGDNLEALKLLHKPYFGKVKMIYIDPPYNTGRDFIYSDRYGDPLDAYLKFTAQKDESGNLLTSNPETSGRFHSAWLSMMYPRLFLAAQLLHDNGVIFVSIDDNEVHNLRRLMNEVFGEENFVATIIWQKIFGPKNTAMYFSEDHDYILVYAKNKAVWRPNSLPRTEEANARYENPDNDPRGPWVPGDPCARNYYSKGTYWVTSPTGKKFRNPIGTYWRIPHEKFLELQKDDRIWWGKDGNSRPTLKRFLSEVKKGMVPQTLWFYKDVGHTAEAKKELLEYVKFGNSDNVIDTVKPTRLIERMLQLATSPSAMDIVLDFFAGTAATAHAVMTQNREDDGNRRFICVQLPERLPVPEKTLKNLVDVCKERIQNVIVKMKKEKKQTKLDRADSPEDLGFRFFRLSQSNYRPWKGVEERNPEKYAMEMEEQLDPLVHGWKKENVIYEVAVKEGLGLTCKIEHEQEYRENEVWRVTDKERGQGFLICLDDKIKTSTIKTLKITKDEIFVCRDIALDDTGAANLALQCRLKTI
jgi:adenine-specific DNA-methyltransferase